MKELAKAYPSLFDRGKRDPGGSPCYTPCPCKNLTPTHETKERQYIALFPYVCYTQRNSFDDNTVTSNYAESR